MEIRFGGVNAPAGKNGMSGISISHRVGLKAVDAAG